MDSPWIISPSAKVCLPLSLFEPNCFYSLGTLSPCVKNSLWTFLKTAESWAFLQLDCSPRSPWCHFEVWLALSLVNFVTFSPRGEEPLSTDLPLPERILHIVQNFCKLKLLIKMEGRYSYSQKGNGNETDFSPPPRKIIKAIALDNLDLIRENPLTPIGRFTNPTKQRLWSLIPFLSNLWNLRGKAIGSPIWGRH